MNKICTLELPDGALYIGEVNDNGLPESYEATCAWPDGSSYIGAWVKGKRSGVGKLYKLGKLIHYGYWWNGELLHEFPNEESTPNSQLHIPATGQGPTQYHPSQSPANNPKTTALIIGNNDYPDSPLHNCINDAQAISAKLRSINVDVQILSNASKSQMINAIKSLEERSYQYENVFFFFSGHGMTNQGRHYIVAIDEKTADGSPLSIEEIDEFLSNTHFKNIIIASDACSVIVSGDGNSEMVKSAGRTIMAFSSSLGAMAYDGIPKEHSPFAFGLLQYITKPMNIVQIFQETNRFAMSYAMDHAFYQQPILVISPYFPIDFRFID